MRNRRNSKPSGSRSSKPDGDQQLLDWSELPNWRRDNHYIHTAYRPLTGSFLTSFSSLFYMHNESLNVYTHLVGAALFALLATRYPLFLPASSTTITSADSIVFTFFFAGAVVCLGISSLFHLFSNHSREVCTRGNQADYVGIVILITGSFVPSVFYGFYCEAFLQKTYWGMISTIGLGCIIMSITPRFRSPIWRPYRAAMFVAMGLSAVFPVIHGLKLYGVTQMNDRIGLFWVVLQGALYILGAGLYAARLPERLNPGMFDIWGSSHQIFHVLVVLAASAHLVGVLKAFKHAHSMATC